MNKKYYLTLADAKKFLNKKYYLTLADAKKFLNKKGLELFKKSHQIKSNGSIRSIYYTILCGLVTIMIFAAIPKIINNQIFFIKTSDEVKNLSKTNLEKVLSGKPLNEENEDLDITNIFEDIFEFEEVPTDTVRLTASTVEQLFKETNYNLDSVRKTKLVKPIKLSLLPGEIGKIESTTKKKNLFIKIVLPLILEENNRIKLDRKKLFVILNKNINTTAEKRWINSKFKQYGVLKRDLSTLKIRMDEVPISLTIAQAAKETGWGTSRFAIEGNALFGQWTWSGEGIKPAKVNQKSKTHKVMKFKVLKASVRAYQRNLNTHSGYKKFRAARAEMRDNGEQLDSLILADYLDKYAETGKEYIKVIKQIIKQNTLQDFDKVKLLPTSIRLKNLI